MLSIELILVLIAQCRTNFVGTELATDLNYPGTDGIISGILLETEFGNRHDTQIHLNLRLRDGDFVENLPCPITDSGSGTSTLQDTLISIRCLVKAQPDG